MCLPTIAMLFFLFQTQMLWASQTPKHCEGITVAKCHFSENATVQYPKRKVCMSVAGPVSAKLDECIYGKESFIEGDCEYTGTRYEGEPLPSPGTIKDYLDCQLYAREFGPFDVSYFAYLGETE